VDFFGIGGGELLVILIVALLIWGPEKLVNVARTMGETVAAFRKAANDLTTQMTQEVEEAKLQADLRDPGKGLNSDLKLDAEGRPAALPAEGKTTPATSQAILKTRSADRGQEKP
jgi:Tat protein translocase TatB subunit